MCSLEKARQVERAKLKASGGTAVPLKPLGPEGDKSASQRKVGEDVNPSDSDRHRQAAGRAADPSGESEEDSQSSMDSASDDEEEEESEGELLHVTTSQDHHIRMMCSALSCTH